MSEPCSYVAHVLAWKAQLASVLLMLCTAAYLRVHSGALAALDFLF